MNLTNIILTSIILFKWLHVICTILISALRRILAEHITLSRPHFTCLSPKFQFQFQLQFQLQFHTSLQTHTKSHQKVLPRSILPPFEIWSSPTCIFDAAILLIVSTYRNICSICEHQSYSIRKLWDRDLPPTTKKRNSITHYSFCTQASSATSSIQPNSVQGIPKHPSWSFQISFVYTTSHHRISELA